MADVNDPKPEPVASSEPKLVSQDSAEPASKSADVEKENASPVRIHSPALSCVLAHIPYALMRCARGARGG